MRDVRTGLGDAVTGFVAELTGHPKSDLPSPGDSGEDWLGVLRQWLARMDYGLVSLASPSTFAWPGHWIGIVDSPDSAPEAVGVLLFGSPSAVIASPEAPELIGRGVEELKFHQGLILVPFDALEKAASRSDRRVGVVAGIYITPTKESPLRSVSVATAIKGRGLEGDRYAAGAVYSRRFVAGHRNVPLQWKLARRPGGALRSADRPLVSDALCFWKL